MLLEPKESIVGPEHSLDMRKQSSLANVLEVSFAGQIDKEKVRLEQELSKAHRKLAEVYQNLNTNQPNE